MRPEMENIVAFLRQYGEAATTDEFNGVTYWTDDQLEEIADRHSYRANINLVTHQFASPTIYTLKIPPFHLMADDYTIYNDETLVNVVSTYSQARSEIEFESALNIDYDYRVQALFVKGYDALADLWDQKANQRHDYVDFRAGNNKMSMQQEYEHCVDRAAYYRGKTIRRWPRQKGKWKV